MLRARAEETKKKDPRFMRLLTINSATEDGDILCCYSTLKILMLLQERQKLVEELHPNQTQNSIFSLMVNEKFYSFASTLCGKILYTKKLISLMKTKFSVGVFALGNMLDMAFKLN